MDSADSREGALSDRLQKAQEEAEAAQKGQDKLNADLQVAKLEIQMLREKFMSTESGQVGTGAAEWMCSVADASETRCPSVIPADR